MEDLFEVVGLENNPILKKLLITRIKHEYEEHADISDYTLWQEYCYLKNSNSLHVLFECEKREQLEIKMAEENAKIEEALPWNNR